MKNFIINKLSVIFLFIVSALAMEIFLFVYLGFGVLPSYILFDLSLIFFVAFIVLFMPCGKGANILIGVMLFLQMILSYMNICIYNALGDVFTFDMLSLVEETTRVITADMFPVWPLVFYVGLYAFDIIFLVLIRKKVKVEKYSYRSAIRFIVKNIALIGLTLSFSLYTLSVYRLKGEESDELYVFSDKVLYNSFASSKQSLIKFGTWGYYFEEFFRRFYMIEPAVSYTKAELQAFANSKEYDPSAQRLYSVAKDSNVLVIMLESFEWYGIDPELTPTLYALANGYDFGTRDPETGLYTNFNFYDFTKGDDGFTQLMRSDYLYIDGEYIKKEGVRLLNESLYGEYGLTLTNYYSKSKTDYSEASVILGNYPYNESFTTHGGLFGYSSKNLYSNVSYSFTLPNILENSGAVDVTNYMHSYLSSFYGRDTLIPQFGFENTLFLDQMSSKIERGESLSHIVRDSDIIDFYLNMSDSYDFLPKDKSFLSFYTTVTTHGEYSYNPLLNKYYEFIDSIDYIGKAEDDKNNAKLDDETAQMARTYLASVLDTEYMITLIVKYLMENDLFENTTLVLFSDHQCYYDGMDINYKGLYFSDDEVGVSSPKYWEREVEYGEEYGVYSQDRFIVPAMIYSTKIDDSVVGNSKNAHFINKFTCAFDLPVTIMNLLGVDYNPSYYLGYPVMCQTVNSDTGAVFEIGIPAYISCTGGIFDDYIYTEDGTTVKFYKSNVVMPADLKAFSYNVSKYIERWYKVTALYKYNMFY